MSRSTLKDFDVISRLGAGSFGTVYKVKRIIDEKLYVMKVVRIGELSHRERSDAINEVQILAQLKSSFVVCYYDSFIEKENLHIVMEFCNRGDLQNLLKKAKERNVSGLKEPIVWNMALQIILGLYYLHKKNILHRDLKSANVFLNKDATSANYHLKIGDLGVAKLMDTSTALARTIVGTPYYLSPELCKDMPYRDKSDCWALGVIIYECCTLEHPFEARNQCALIMKIIEAPVKPPPSSNASSVLVNLILWLLQKDPRLRPSIRDILKEVEVRHRLRDEGLELPEELLHVDTTNYLQEGLPTTLPKEVEEKASSAASSGIEEDGTVALMTTLVDDKDANHRSFRVAAAALSAQSSSNRMNVDNNANASAPVVSSAQQRTPSGRFITPQTVETTSTAPSTTNAAVPTGVKRSTPSVSRNNSGVSNVSSTASATVSVSNNVSVATTASTSVVGNRVRGNNRGRGRLTSDKARTRYQRPPVAPSSTTTSSSASTVVAGQQQTNGASTSTSSIQDEGEGDEDGPYDEDNEEEYDDDNEDIMQGEQDDDPRGAIPSHIDSTADAKFSTAVPDPNSNNARRPSVIAKELESMRLAEEKDASSTSLPTPDAKKLRSGDSKADVKDSKLTADEENDDDKYESDFVPEEENDQYDASANIPIVMNMNKPPLQQPLHHHKHHFPTDSKDVSFSNSTTLHSGSSTLQPPSYQHMMLQQTGSGNNSYHHSNYNRSMMSTAASEFNNFGGPGNQTTGEDAELWNSIWTEKRGMVGNEALPAGQSMDDNDFETAPGPTAAVAVSDTAAEGSSAIAAVVPVQEVEDMLVMARNKAIADLGEGLFTKIYSLLSRHMRQDHDGDTASEEDGDQSINLRMLQELETLLSEELQVHGVALVSDAVFRVRALLAFESKCAGFLSPPPLVKRKSVVGHSETGRTATISDTVQDPWTQQQHPPGDYTAEVIRRK